MLGGADCVWRDVAESERILGPEWWDVVIAANDVASHWPRPLDYLVSLHPNKFAAWLRARAEAGHPGVPTLVAKDGSGRKHADRTFRHPYGGGSSGLLAVAWAMHIGCERIVTAGIPLERVPHFEESRVHVRGRPWNGMSHRRKWRDHAGALQGVVKSMSMVWDPTTKQYVPSFTRRLLGAPTPEWLEGHNEQEA